MGGKLLNECGRQEGDSSSHIIQGGERDPRAARFRIARGSCSPLILKPVQNVNASKFSKPEHREHDAWMCVHATWTAGCRPQQCGIEITLHLSCSNSQNSVQVWVGGKFELPVIETGARGAEKWLEPKWHQFTTAAKRVSITYEQSCPPLR